MSSLSRPQVRMPNRDGSVLIRDPMSQGRAGNEAHQRLLRRERSIRPQSSSLMQRQRMLFLKSFCILSMRLIRRSISLDFFCASLRHRAEAGVPSRNPWKKSLISAMVKPALRATSIIAK
jgi:hypothetical protein